VETDAKQHTITISDAMDEIPPDGAQISSGSPDHPPRQGLLKFCPHQMVESVRQIDPEDLKRRGIEAVILDLDNTLVRWREDEMTREVAAWLEELQATGIKLCILSNSILSKRSARMAERLGTLNVGKARKPSRQGFRRALAALGTEPAVTAIVGDQMFTDILGGNRVGVYTIMVRPLHRKEFVYTRLIHRPPERLLLSLFKRRGHL